MADADENDVKMTEVERLAGWQRVFGKHYESLKTKRAVPDSHLAKDLGVSPGAFSNWRTRSVPKLSLFPKIASVLANRDPLKAITIENELRVAVGRDSTGDEPPLLRAQKNSSIKISIVEYPVFNQFFRRLLENLLRLAATNPVLVEEATNLTDVPKQLSEGTADVVGAIFATPDRLKSMRFMTTPIRLGIAKIGSQGATGRELLTIVNEKEVGYTYARYTLQKRQTEIKFVDYDKASFAKAYLECGGNAEIYVDDLMAMQVMAEIFKRLKSRPSASEAIKMLPEITISSGRQAKSSSVIQPKYYLGISVFREEREWFEYLTEAWDIFASSNQNYISALYCQLYDALLDEQKSATQGLASSMPDWNEAKVSSFIKAKRNFLDIWAKAIESWLRFDHVDDNSTINIAVQYPWSRIVRMAYDRSKDAPEKEGA